MDELDQASPAAVSELLTYLDYLPTRTVVLATTNEYGKLRAMTKSRLESRFVRLRVEAPSVEQTAGLLHRRHGIPKAEDRHIALGAVPEGCLLLAFGVIIGLGFLFWQQRRNEARRNEKTDSDLAELRAQTLKWSDEKTRVIEQCIATLGPRESGYHAPPRRRASKPPGSG